MSGNLVIVIPAAGSSSRLGRPKQLVEFEGVSLVRRAAETAIEASPDLVVVTGCEDIAVRDALKGIPVQVIDNPDWEKGMGRSIAVGVQQSLDLFPECAGILIFLCDLPTIDSGHLKRLIKKHGLEDLDLAYTKYTDTIGVPAVFGPRYFEDLIILDGDEGAKSIIGRGDDGRKMSVDFTGHFEDIDLPEDL
ncbi:MAG: nucleotidyltransferase family protein [Pyrinomonadaceae bacterium]|nr:nucleotidyltransferase family protein [Pyrinomonadaceae bacterium]